MALASPSSNRIVVPSCQLLPKPQTHKGKGRTAPQKNVQEECSSDRGEPDRATEIAAHAELFERQQAHDDDATAATAATAAAVTNVTLATGSAAATHTTAEISLAAPVATCAAVPVAAFATATAQTLLPPGTYQSPLLTVVPWDVMQHLLAPQQHGEPRHFNAQGDPVNSHGNPHVRPPPAGLKGSNGGSHASWKKREKEKAKRQQKAVEKRVLPLSGGE